MKALKFVVALLFLGTEAVAADAVWIGADGDALDNPANWSGGDPFYDATDNPTTPLCFNASASARLQDGDMQIYQLKTGAGDVSVSLDLNGKFLWFGGASAINWNSKTGASYAFKDGGMDFTPGAGTLSMGAGSSVTFDNVAATGRIYCAALESTVVLTNGTRLLGRIEGFDGNKNSKVVIAGPGTVVDCQGYGFVVGGRNNEQAYSNSLYITDHAVVTNVGSKACACGFGDFESLGTGMYVEISNGSRVYGQGSTKFIASRTYGGTTFRILSGSVVSNFTGFGVARGGGADNLLEIAGEGTQYYAAEGGADNYIGYTASSVRARAWVHDHAFVRACAHIDGYAADQEEPALDVEDHATFDSSGYDVSIGNQGAWRPRLKVDNYSTFKCARFFFGKANCPRDVLVWIGDHSTMTCSGYVSDAVGTVNTLVLSNGMFSVGSGQSFTVTGTNTIVFAGRAPQLHIFGLSQGGRLTFRFDIPAEGYEAEHPCLDIYRQNADLVISSVIVPEFNLDRYVKAGGGKVLLAQVDSTRKMSFASDEIRERWETALAREDAKCKLEIVDDTKLYLTCTPKKGMMILLR